MRRAGVTAWCPQALPPPRLARNASMTAWVLSASIKQLVMESSPKLLSAQMQAYPMQAHVHRGRHRSELGVGRSGSYLFRAKDGAGWDAFSALALASKSGASLAESLALCCKNAISDSLNIRCSKEVSRFRFSEGLESIAEVVAPVSFELVTMFLS